jgi:hypothetical protein
MQVDDVRPSLGFLRAFTEPKHPTGSNEDKWHKSPDGRICAVSDGASVSFDSGLWAEILARRFVEDPTVSHAWLEAAIAEYQRGYDREEMSWWQQAAFDRGSFATLLGVTCLPEGGSVRITAFGDSLVAVLDGANLVCAIPYVEPTQFDQAPQLLSTNPFENRSLDDASFAAAVSAPEVASHESLSLLLMTDAIGRWLLDRPDAERVTALLNIRDDEAFVEFVEKERADGQLRRDDTTLVVMGDIP